ncbi:hypothetical protein [Microcoleus sp. D2_18a_D3]
MPVPQEKMPVLPEKRLIILQQKAAKGKMPVHDISPISKLKIN